MLGWKYWTAKGKGEGKQQDMIERKMGWKYDDDDIDDERKGFHFHLSWLCVFSSTFIFSGGKEERHRKNI